MKGQLSIQTILFLLVALSISGGFYLFYNRLVASGTAGSSESLVYPEVPPQIVDLKCYTDHGYVVLESEGTAGDIRYRVEESMGDYLKEGTLEVNVSGYGGVYFGAFMDEGSGYSVRLYTPSWSVSDSCTARVHDGVALYLPLDEAGGGVARDRSANDNDGTLNGLDHGTITNANWTTGVNGTALNFTGDGYVITGYDGVFLQEMTASVWFRIESWGSHAVMGRFHWGSGHNQGWMLYRNNPWIDGDMGWFFRYNQTDGVSSYLNERYTGLQTDTWYHAAVRVYPNGTYNTFLNGQPYKSATASNFQSWGGNVTDPSEKLALGRSGESTGSWFNGSVDDVRIYNRALNSTEVGQLYSGQEVSHGLVGHWPLDEGSGTTARDNHTWAGGKRGTALHFDGVDDRIYFSEISKSSGDEWTFSHWLHYNSSAERYIFYAGDIHETGKGLLVRYDNQDRFGYRDGSSNYYLAGASESGPYFGKWSHVAWVMNDTDGLSLYADGQLLDGWAITDANMEFNSLGRAYSSAAYYFNDLLDEVYIYDRALTAEEVAAIHSAHS